TEALKNITVKSFAIKTGFSVEYFTRLFKEKVKQSPYQFILEHKMSKARELLRDGMSIAEICEKIGYEDLKSFEKIFKKKHGYTASQYRKNQDKYF
ncbi:MAG: helix-turn-helix transcriptional regulator, partial [Clostridia bacterium]